MPEKYKASVRKTMLDSLQKIGDNVRSQTKKRQSSFLDKNLRTTCSASYTSLAEDIKMKQVDSSVSEKVDNI